MPDDVQSPLLEGVHKVNEGAGCPRVGHEEEDLRAPELDVLLAGIQEEQVLPHLQKERKHFRIRIKFQQNKGNNFEGFFLKKTQQFVSIYLVE